MNKKIGLVLCSSGAMGAYETGVIKALSDAKLSFNLITANSVGALNASMFICGQVDELISIWEKRISLELIYQPNSAGLFFKPSKLKAMGCHSHLRDLISKTLNLQTLKESKMQLMIVATNLQSGHQEAFIKLEDGKLFVETKAGIKEIRATEVDNVLLNALLASVALPIVFAPIKIVGQQYVDAGVSNKPPLKRAIMAGCEEIFTVLPRPLIQTPADVEYKHLADLSARVLEIALPDALEEDIQRAELINQAIKNWQGLSANISTALSKSKSNSLSEQIENIIQGSLPFRGKKLVNIHPIRPVKDLNVTMFDFDSQKLTRILRKGYQDGCKKIEELFEQGRLSQIGGQRIECAACDDKYATGCEGKKIDRKFFDTIDRFIGKEIHHE